MRSLFRRRHWTVRCTAEEIHAEEPEERAQRKQKRIAKCRLTADVRFPGVDYHTAEKRQCDRNSGCGSSPLPEEPPKLRRRDQIAHPRIPCATTDGCHSLIDCKRAYKHHDARRRPEQRSRRRAKQKASANAGSPHANVAPGAQPFYQEHRGDLQELHEEGYGREYTDRKVGSAEFDGKASQEHTRGQRPHSLASERVVEDKAKRAPPAEVRIRSIVTALSHCLTVKHSGSLTKTEPGGIRGRNAGRRCFAYPAAAARPVLSEVDGFRTQAKQSRVFAKSS